MRAGKGYWGYSQEGLNRFMATFGIQDESYFLNGFGFIAEENDKVIGYYLFKTDETPPMLDHFFLDTHLIGKGYGRKLWDHCIEQAREKAGKNLFSGLTPIPVLFTSIWELLPLSTGPW